MQLRCCLFASKQRLLFENPALFEGVNIVRMGVNIMRIHKQWNDVSWLRSFFKENISDLSLYFKMTDVNRAICATIDDAEKLQCLMMDMSSAGELDKIFRPLETQRTSDALLGKEKARLRREMRRPSWLRIYAIKLSAGVYIVTGGAIKLTGTMNEREHTLQELRKLEMVRTFLLEERIVDNDGFIEYLSEV